MPYFDLNRSYADVRDRGRGKSGFVDASMDFGQGLRILQQDPWEMLVTFIISQRKSMPAIATSVEALCEKFGEPIALPGGEEAVAFPTAEALVATTDDDLRACSLGYRAPYVADAARRVVDGDLDLDAAAAMGDVELFEYLQTVHGVGKKVANCVCLFGFGRTSLVPVDVWIARAIDERCDGCDPFAQYGADAGIMQQYVFYYMTQTRGK
jgi:N-glycosylase/DNA lyase